MIFNALEFFADFAMNLRCKTLEHMKFKNVIFDF